MKYIQFRDYDGGLKTKAVVRMVINTNPRGMTVDEIRRRCKIMDLIDDAATHIVVKNDDFDLIKTALNSHPWTVADKNLLQLIDDVLASDEPSAALMPNGRGHDAPERKSKPSGSAGAAPEG